MIYAEPTVDVSSFGEVAVIKHKHADRSEVGAHKDILELISIDEKVLRIELSGECCDISFFEEKALADAKDLIGTRLREIERIQLQGRVENGDGDFTAYHALIIRADKFSITLDWRNESNGFYTGYAELFLNGKHLK